MELNSAAMMGSIITWYRIPLTPAHVLRTIRAHLDLARIFIAACLGES